MTNFYVTESSQIHVFDNKPTHVKNKLLKFDLEFTIFQSA